MYGLCKYDAHTLRLSLYAHSVMSGLFDHRLEALWGKKHSAGFPLADNYRVVVREIPDKLKYLLVKMSGNARTNLAIT